MLISRLPIIAFKRPPGWPGGGVEWVKRMGERAAMPSDRSAESMKASQIRPNKAAPIDKVMNAPLVKRRRRYRPLETIILHQPAAPESGASIERRPAR